MSTLHGIAKSQEVRRREFLKGVSSAVLSTASAKRAPAGTDQTSQSVRTVYVVAKCHLDVGFTDTERNVLLKYFDDYFPQAMKVAQALRVTGGKERYVWTIASWMLYEYLEQASPTQRIEMEQAIQSGDIAWHAMPFTWQSEMLDQSLIVSALKISALLDRRFGKRTIAGKLTDVPGHSRGIITPLADAGIEFLDIGDNPGCKAPAVPVMKVPEASFEMNSVEDSESLAPEKAKIVSELMQYGLTEHEARRLISDAPMEAAPHLFNWRNPTGAQVMVLYHPFGYGGTMKIPRMDFAASIRVAADNLGPHSADEVKAYYSSLRRQFPEAEIVATDLSTLGAKLKGLGPELPVLTQEIGDTWIYGVGSDPGKVACYRELCRLRREWLSQKRFSAGGPVDMRFSSRLILGAEHNWGLSTGQYLKHPEIYSPGELVTARTTSPAFQKMDDEWNAKRRDIDIALATLPADLHEQARGRLSALIPDRPALRRNTSAHVTPELKASSLVISLDQSSGAIVKFTNRKTGREWASPQSALARFQYETFTSADFKRFNAEYNTAKFAANDFGKPGLDKYAVQSRTWQPRLQSCTTEEEDRGQRLLAELHMPPAEPDLADLLSWPSIMTLEIWVPNDESAAYLTFQCFGKRANRLPEAMWLSFSPDAPDANGWLLQKIDELVSPLDVIINGSRHLHAVTKDVTYRDANGGFTLETLDAPLIAPGQPSLLRFDNELPDMRQGIHVNLYNNLWGTAFPQWYERDMRFRFVVRV